jgi:hypothetical protein
MTSIFLLYVIGTQPSWDIFGRIFIGFFLMVQNHYRDLCFLLQMSMTYHPQMDGQTKFLSRTLEETCLCYFIEEQPRKDLIWGFTIGGKHQYNQLQECSNCSLVEVPMDAPPQSLLKFISGGILVSAMTQDLMDRDEAPRQLKLHLDRAQSHMTH